MTAEANPVLLALANERDAVRLDIVQAMHRMLEGRTQRRMTITALAEEAGVKRHLLTHKHTDLRDLFKRELERTGQGHEPPIVSELRAALADMTKRHRDRGKEIAELKRLVSDYAENLAVMTALLGAVAPDADLPPDDSKDIHSDATTSGAQPSEAGRAWRAVDGQVTELSTRRMEQSPDNPTSTQPRC